MRVALCALALATIASSTALAQVTDLQAQPGAALQIQGAHLLNGTWRVGGMGDVTITTRPEGVLEGRLGDRPCHGQYEGNAFALWCPSDRRGPILISGQVAETAPVNTRGRARILGGGARMVGQIHQTYLGSRGHTEELGEFTADRR